MFWGEVMPLVHMVLADSDAEYVQRLAQWFRENKPRQFQISAFTARESFENYLKSGNLQADVILLNEQFLTPELLEKGNLIILGSTATGFPSVDKYQTASSLCSAVLSHMSGWQPSGAVHGNGGKSNVIVCFSPELRLKSTMALWLARMSSDHLYISLEAFPAFCLQNETGGKNLSDIFYHIKALKGNLTIALESLVCNGNGISYIPPMDNSGDLWELTDKETGILAETLLSWGRFSNIVVDLEFNTSPRTLQWLEMASCVIVPFTAAYPEPILRMKSKHSYLPGAGTDKYRWVLAGEGHTAGLKDQFETLYWLPWLEALPQRFGTLSLEMHAFGQLKALLAGQRQP